MTVGELRYLVTADTGGFDRAAGRTRRVARNLDGLRATLGIGATGVKSTLGSLAGVRAAAEAVDEQDVDVDVRTRGVVAAMGAMSGFASTVRRTIGRVAELGSTIRGSVRRIGGMQAAGRQAAVQMARMGAAVAVGIALLPTLASLAVAAAGALASIASIAAVAGAGIAAFAVSAVGNLNEVTDAMDELRKVREDLQEARREGDQEAINEALAERARILGELNPAQQQLLRSIQDARQAYQDFLDTTSRPVSDALTDWIDLAAPALDMIEPLVTAADALGGLSTVAEDMMTSDFWQDFVALLSESVGPAFEEFGRIARPLFRALGELLAIFIPYGMDFLDWLSGLAERFANWAQSEEGQKQVEGFMQLAADLGPDIAEAMGNIAEGVGALMLEFASDEGLGGLQIVSGFFEWLAEGDNASRVENALYGIAAALGAVALAVVLATGGLPLLILLVASLGAAVGYWFPEIRDWALGVGDTLTWVFTEKIPQGWNTFKNFFINSWNDFKNWWISQWESFRDTVVSVAQGIWDRIEQGWNTFKNFFLETVPQWGSDIINGMKDGIDDAMSGIGEWLDNNVWQPIKNAVLGLFGISSPSKKFAWFGNQMILGLIEGLGQGGWGSMIDKIFGGASDRAAQALGWLVQQGRVSMSALADAGSWVWDKLSGLGGALGDLFGGGSAGAGVQRWAGLVSQVLGMLGQPQDLVDDVLQRMQQESGGDPRAINRWDINAMRGDPSRGLMQTIGSTFRAYAGPFQGRGIYDPLANIYAALRYSMDRYGSIARAMHQPGGYAQGSWRIPQDQVAQIHKGEMILPQQMASAVRGALSGSSGGASGPMAVAGGQLELSRNSRGELEAWVRDITVQEIGDDAEFRSRKGALG